MGRKPGGKESMAWKKQKAADYELLREQEAEQLGSGHDSNDFDGDEPPLAQPAGGELQRGAVRAYTSTRPHNLKIYREYLLKRLLL